MPLHRSRSRFLHELARVLLKDVRTVRRYCERGLIPKATKTRGGHWCGPSATDMSRIERRAFLRRIFANIRAFSRGPSNDPWKGIKFGEMSGESIESEVACSLLENELLGRDAEPWPLPPADQMQILQDADGTPYEWMPPEGPTRKIACGLDDLSNDKPERAVEELLVQIAERLTQQTEAKDYRAYKDSDRGDFDLITAKDLREELDRLWSVRKVRVTEKMLLRAISTAAGRSKTALEASYAEGADGKRLSKAEVRHGKSALPMQD